MTVQIDSRHVEDNLI